MAPLASLPVPDLKISPLRRPRKVTEGPRQIFILTHSRRILAASPTFCPPSGGSLRAAQAPRVSPPLHTSQSLQGGGGGWSRKPSLWAPLPKVLPPHHSPLAHRAPRGAPAGLGSFTGGGNAGSRWVAVLRGHPGGAGRVTETRSTGL